MYMQKNMLILRAMREYLCMPITEAASYMGVCRLTITRKELGQTPIEKEFYQKYRHWLVSFFSRSPFKKLPEMNAIEKIRWELTTRGICKSELARAVNLPVQKVKNILYYPQTAKLDAALAEQWLKIIPTLSRTYKKKLH